MASALSLAFVFFAGLCAVHGDIATIEDYPSVVQVEFAGAYLGLQVCTGTIITNRHVLSAARCFSGPLFDPRLRRVRAGATYRGFGGTLSRVESVSNHPSFGTHQHEGDISVVRLADNLVFDATIQTSPIISQDFVLPAALPVIHVGWGSTAQDTLILARPLIHDVLLQTVSQESCVEQYASLPVTVSSTMICASTDLEEGMTHDFRDGGAPVFYDGILVGIITLGLPVCDSFPLVVTRVAYYSTWITQAAV